MARLPFDEIDVLIVDRIGKDISGTGMDTNVTGRNRDLLGDFTSRPRVKRIFIRDLTAETKGNANGVGFADFVTTRLVEKMDRQETYVNSLTAISPEKASIPIYFDTDREVLKACLDTIGDIAPSKARVVHIQDTLSLKTIAVSEACAPDLEARSGLDRLTPWTTPPFDERGNLISPFA